MGLHPLACGRQMTLRSALTATQRRVDPLWRRSKAVTRACLLCVAAAAALLGSAILLPLSGNESMLLLWILAISTVVHLLMVWGEVSLTHPTAHARLRAHPPAIDAIHADSRAADHPHRGPVPLRVRVGGALEAGTTRGND